MREYARHVEGLGATGDGQPVWGAQNSKERVAHGARRRDSNRSRIPALRQRPHRAHQPRRRQRTPIGTEPPPTWRSKKHPDAGARVVGRFPARLEVATALARDESSPTGAPSSPTPSTSCATHRSSAASSSSDPSRRSARRTASRLGTTPTPAASIGTRSPPTRKTIVETEARSSPVTQRPKTRSPTSAIFSCGTSRRAGRGGLEHRDSRRSWPSRARFRPAAGYLDVLSLIAHEFFHLWNVKRIGPAGLFPYRYEQENYTRMLWWFEGATSYYDWRTLRLAKLCTAAEYLNHLAEEIARLEDTPGAARSFARRSVFRCVDQGLSARRKLAQQHGQLLPKGRDRLVRSSISTLRHRTEGRVSSRRRDPTHL